MQTPGKDTKEAIFSLAPYIDSGNKIRKMQNF